MLSIKVTNQLKQRKRKKEPEASPKITMEPYFVDLAGTGPLSVQGCLKGVTFLRGPEGEAKCHRLTGIPYALPPVGDLRWRRPLPLPQGYRYGGDDQLLECTSFPPACAQLRCPEFLAPLVSGDAKNGFSEACLNLNMWMPAGGAPLDGWPVYFYLRESAANSIVSLSQITDNSLKTAVFCSLAMPTSSLFGIPLICSPIPMSAA